ncbi:MAG TPA: hypothetical protein VEC37_16490 [Bacillota bacterium]|nr:hypothetical protein [Bacillota bacterium]
MAKQKFTGKKIRFNGDVRPMPAVAIPEREKIVASTICTKEFETTVKRVRQKDYKAISSALQAKTESSLDKLRKILK